MFYSWFQRSFLQRLSVNRLISLAFLLTLLSGNPYPVLAAADLRVPPGFELVSRAPGVEFYRKDYPGGSPDFVQVIDLSQGASVSLLHGEITAPGNGQGVYGGDNARFVRKSIQGFWNELASQSEGAFCVSNGQFFRMADSPTPLPFPLKTGGEILTDGYAIKEFIDQKLILELWPGRADIQTLTQESLYNSDAPDIVAGLTEDASKASKKAVGRTFVGIADGDGLPGYEILMIFNTRTSKPKDAADVLRDFGAQKVMMLDGGGSTQLICNGETIINTERLIPQALGVASGTLQAYAGSLVAAPEWPVFVAGGSYNYEMQIRNSGSQPWIPNSTHITVEDLDKGTRQKINLPANVPAGEEVSVTIALSPMEGTGVHSARLVLEAGGEDFPVQQGTVGWVVLPPSMMQRRAELEEKLADTPNRSPENVQAEIEAMLAENKGVQPGTQVQEQPGLSSGVRETAFIDINDAVLVPLLMIPVVALLIFIVRQLNDRFR